MERYITHNMEITYCKGWSRRRKQLLEIWDEKKACKAHKTGKLYTVLIGDPQKPRCFLEVHLKLGFVGVSFLDEHLRDYLDFSFLEKLPGKLFLGRVIYREYDADTDNVISAKTMSWEPDGKTQFEQADLVQNFVDTGEGSMDVSINWEPIPEFGQYESIARFER
jgi:hypothetical protein